MLRGSPGERNCKAKLTTADVLAIRASHEPPRVLAPLYGVSVDTIGNIRQRRTWDHIQAQAEQPSDEEWRAIEFPDKPALNGRYEASAHGRIRSTRLAKAVRIAKTTQYGYLRIVLCADYKQSHHHVHKLVASCFIGPRPNGLQVNHINGIKTDNRAANLEYVTPRENIRHAMRHGLIPPQTGIRKDNRMFTFNGVTMHLSAWAKSRGLRVGTVGGRLHRGWSIERALELDINSSQPR